MSEERTIDGGKDRRAAQRLADWIVHQHFVELDSTQSFVEKEHMSFAQDKLTVVSADFQTSGRGTGARQWLASRCRSVLMTFFFRFPQTCPNDFVNRNAASVTRVLSVAAIDTLQQVTQGHRDVDGNPLTFGVKWPNDIVVSDRKIGGILARAVPFNGRLEGIILGIGINVNTPSCDLSEIERPVWPAISLHVATGGQQTFDVPVLRQRLALAFAAELEDFFREGFIAFRDRVNRLEVLMGKTVLFRVHETRKVEGIFEGVDETGLIQLRVDGSIHTFPSGEIIPRSPI